MITRGSKFFFGGAIIAYIAALVYGFITGASVHGGVISVFQNGDVVDSIVGPISFGWKGWVGEHVGYSTLMASAAISAVLGGFMVVFRDGDAESIVGLQGTEMTADKADLRVATPQGFSPWPIGTALALGIIVVGAVYSTATMVVGGVLLVLSAFQWTVRSWSEQLTVDPARNVALRAKLMNPYNVPGAAILIIALVMFLMSRILLALPSVGAVFLIIATAAAVFVVALLLAGRPDLRRTVLIAALVAGGLVLVLAGIAGGIAGTYHAGEEGAPVTTGTTATPASSVPAGNIHTGNGAGTSGSY